MFERACRSEDLPAFGGPANATCATPSDRKSTRLNSSHDQISYAVFCLKKKKKPCSVRSGGLALLQELGHNLLCGGGLCVGPNDLHRDTLGPHLSDGRVCVIGLFVHVHA